MTDYQHILFPYAYNILGSADDAKDAIQDVIVNYTSMNIRPDNEKNYLIKGVINRSINIKRQKRKLQPLEAWLPEPVSTETPSAGYELKELLTYSVLFLLEHLNPKERAVFILKEAFGYTHEEIAEVLSLSVENSRKLLSRAAKKIRQKEVPPVAAALSLNHVQQLDRFVSAIRSNDMDALHHLLSDEILFYADGGKDLTVAKKFCKGIEEVSNLLVYVHHTFLEHHTIRTAFINHQPALLMYRDGHITTCQIFEFEHDGSTIKRICSIVDPKKLTALPLPLR